MEPKSDLLEGQFEFKIGGFARALGFISASDIVRFNHTKMDGLDSDHNEPKENITSIHNNEKVSANTRAIAINKYR